MKFGLTSDEYELLNNLAIDPLKKYGAKVWIFGSRARGDQRSFSDVDILFELPVETEFESGFLFEIKDRLEESRLPYKVDLVQLQDVAVSYLPGILKDRIEL